MLVCPDTAYSAVQMMLNGYWNVELCRGWQGLHVKFLADVQFDLILQTQLLGIQMAFGQTACI